MRSERYAEKPKLKRNNAVLKAALIAIVLLALMCTAAVIYSYKSAKDSLAVSFTDDSVTLEFGEKISAMDCVLSSEGDVSPADEFLDTGSLGGKEMIYTVSKPVLGGLLTASGEYTLHYSVADTVPPLMIWSGNGTVLKRGGGFDINDVIAYGDNADPAPSVDVEGHVEMMESGEYPLHVTVTDASGNSTEWDLTVEVADEYPEYTDDARRTRFSSFKKANKGSGKSLGIDVSVWQGDIDFEVVKKAGCDFVIIRIGYSEEGNITIDSRFDQNIKAAKEAGLKVGIYMFSYDSSEEAVRTMAGKFIDKLGGESLDLPVAFDWEDFGNYQDYGMSFYSLNKLYDVFAEEMKAAGYDTMLYGSLTYLEKLWDTEDRAVWLAHYTDKTDYKGPYTIWQASSTGRIKGIKGDVDLDVMTE